MPLIKKIGGHEDQLSRKFLAMDYWRVKSLYNLRTHPNLSEVERENLKTVLLKKTKILLAGYKKHNNLENYDEIYQIERSVKQEAQQP